MPIKELNQCLGDQTMQRAIPSRDTDKKKRMWAHIANSALNGGHSEASAIQQANAAVHKMDIDRDEIMGRIADWLRKNALNFGHSKETG